MSSSASLQTALRQLCQPVRRRDYPQSLATMRALRGATSAARRNALEIVVTGSSGKSSLGHRLAALLQANGLRSGCYLSPHLHSFRERFLLNGNRIDLPAFCEGAALVAQAADKLPVTVSSFERGTALALWWFQQCEVPLVVLETGIGGRFDAVNVVDNCLALFTRIEEEHTEWLGGDLASVAWHKAGILQPGGHAVSAPQTPEVAAILLAEARRVGAELQFTDLDLAAAALVNLADRGLLQLASDLPKMPLSALPGRLEPVTPTCGPPLLIDGGHTAEAGRYLRTYLERESGFTGGIQLVAGFLADKDACAWLKVFDDPRFHITLTRAPGHRAADPQRISAACRLARAGLDLVPDVGDALRLARQSKAQAVVVSGSLRLAAHVRELLGLLSAAELAEARLTASVFSGAGYLSRLPD
ncbi:MAG: hypothetical protein OXB89_07390 [Anaerolineaceae bacterium]|nr:hypothetical protein [Anaerolineaceae bacterium]